LSETLEKLRSQILQDARLKAEQIIRESEQEAQIMIEAAKKEAQHQRDEIISRARMETEVIKRKIISSELQRSRWKILEEKNKLIDEVFKEAWEEISRIANVNGEYKPILEGLIAEAIKALGVNRCIIKLSEKDKKRFNLDKLEFDVTKMLNMNVKISWNENSLDALGGAVVSTEDGKISFNNTLDARFERVERKLFFEVAKILFGKKE
jgi:vacuolar-type H+-ATPase subunit E/Vma4